MTSTRARGAARRIHPVVLGSGQRLFGPADDRISLTLVDTAATSTGVILATYRPTGD